MFVNVWTFIILKRIKTFDKNPLKGGMPATEKKIKRNEKAQSVFDLKKFDNVDRYIGACVVSKNKVNFFWETYNVENCIHISTDVMIYITRKK